jgi:hypothetical protein
VPPKFRRKIPIEFQSFNVRHSQLSWRQSTIFAVPIVA